MKQGDVLAALNPSSLNTVRCLTYLDRQGTAHVIGATLRLGAGTMVVDNASSGGMFCGIDIDRGCLFGGAINKKGEVFARHPTTGIVFEGYALPDLPAIFRMCRQSHAWIGQPLTIGWDVAVSPDGPVLLEGNPRWMAKLHTAVDRHVAARMWSAYLDEWGHFDIGFDRAELIKQSGLRFKSLSVVLKIEGKVQKVGYRKWIANHAKERALSGQIENLEDGSVRLHLSGPVRRVEAMLLLAATGPRNARVTAISLEDVDLSVEEDFKILA